MPVGVLFLGLDSSSVDLSNPDIILRLLLFSSHTRFGPSIGKSNEILSTFLLVGVNVVIQILSLLTLWLGNCRINDAL